MSLLRRGTDLESRERVEWQKPTSEGRGQRTLDGSAEGKDTAGPLLSFFPLGSSKDFTSSRRSYLASKTHSPVPWPHFSTRKLTITVGLG